MMPERIELPGSFRLEKRNDGTYALFGKGSDWQVGCIGVEAITEFAEAMTRPAPERHNELREALRDIRSIAKGARDSTASENRIFRVLAESVLEIAESALAEQAAPVKEAADV